MMTDDVAIQTIVATIIWAGNGEDRLWELTRLQLIRTAKELHIPIENVRTHSRRLGNSGSTDRKNCWIMAICDHCRKMWES